MAGMHGSITETASVFVRDFGILLVPEDVVAVAVFMEVFRHDRAVIYEIFGVANVSLTTAASCPKGLHPLGLTNAYGGLIRERTYARVFASNERESLQSPKTLVSYIQAAS